MQISQQNFLKVHVVGGCMHVFSVKSKLHPPQDQGNNILWRTLVFYEEHIVQIILGQLLKLPNIDWHPTFEGY